MSFLLWISMITGIRERHGTLWEPIGLRFVASAKFWIVWGMKRCSQNVQCRQCIPSNYALHTMLLNVYNGGTQCLHCMQYVDSTQCSYCIHCCHCMQFVHCIHPLPCIQCTQSLFTFFTLHAMYIMYTLYTM